VGVGRECRGSCGQRLPRHVLWRLAGEAHGQSYERSCSNKAQQGFSTEPP
jgi:hypothetical protein